MKLNQLLSSETHKPKIWAAALGVGITTGLAYYAWSNYQTKEPVSYEVQHEHSYGSGMSQSLAAHRRR